MTREEFVQGYARRSGMTAEDLRLHGLIAVPCRCGHPSCKGWQMSTQGNIEMLVHFGEITPEEAAEAIAEEYF